MNKITPLIAVSIITLLLVVLETRPLPTNNVLWVSILNTGHAPMFGIISISLLILIRHLNTQLSNKILHVYILVFFLSLLLALSSEWLQSFNPQREADIIDFLFDITGSITFLLVYFLYDPKVKVEASRCNSPIRRLILAFVALSWIVVSTPLLITFYTYHQQSNIFPRLISVQNNISMPFISTRSGKINIQKIPATWAKNKSSKAIKWETNLTTDWPFIRIDENIANWKNYNKLILNIISTSRQKVRLILRTDDLDFSGGQPHRIQTHATLNHGHNRVTLNLNQSPSTLLFLKNRIKHVWLALPKPSHQHTFYITDLYLE